LLSPSSATRQSINPDQTTYELDPSADLSNYNCTRPLHALLQRPLLELTPGPLKPNQFHYLYKTSKQSTSTARCCYQPEGRWHHEMGNEQSMELEMAQGN
jgi:hypothetical protein